MPGGGCLQLLDSPRKLGHRRLGCQGPPLERDQPLEDGVELAHQFRIEALRILQGLGQSGEHVAHGVGVTLHLVEHAGGLSGHRLGHGPLKGLSAPYGRTGGYAVRTESGSLVQRLQTGAHVAQVRGGSVRDDPPEVLGEIVLEVRRVLPCQPALLDTALQLRHHLIEARRGGRTLISHQREC